MAQGQDSQRDEFLRMALDFAIEGIKHDPGRAEFYCGAGDIYLFKGELHKAIAFYGAAQKCINPKELMGAYEGAVYSFVDCYGLVPSLQLSKCFFQMGRIADAKAEAKACSEKYKNAEAAAILAEIERIEGLTKLDNNQTPCDDIVITCPPQSAYPFDEEIYKTKPLGGSETALVQMAKYLKELTKRPVKVFNMREETLVAESGVEYISNKTLNEYLSKNKDYVSIRAIAKYIGIDYGNLNHLVNGTKQIKLGLKHLEKFDILFKRLGWVCCSHYNQASAWLFFLLYVVR